MTSLSDTTDQKTPEPTDPDGCEYADQDTLFLRALRADLLPIMKPATAQRLPQFCRTA